MNNEQIKQALNILDNMDDLDPNVMTLKTLLNSLENDTKFYMLRYKGKYVTFNVTVDHRGYGSEGTYTLNTEEVNPIWTAPDLITALYAKYINTPWFNSSVETPTRNFEWDLDEVEVVDNLGNVCNRKLITNKTKAILYDKINGDKGLLPILKDKVWANAPIPSLYMQKELLKEMKKKHLKNRKAGK